MACLTAMKDTGAHHERSDDYEDEGDHAEGWPEIPEMRDCWEGSIFSDKTEMDKARSRLPRLAGSTGAYWHYYHSGWGYGLRTPTEVRNRWRHYFVCMRHPVAGGPMWVSVNASRGWAPKQ